MSAKRGGSKALSVEHEDHIARLYRGQRSASSGAADNDQGDVRTEHELFECKLTGRPGAPARSTLLTQFAKVADEAYGEGREPAMALRFFSPDSPLANSNGWVDLTVRRTPEDAYRCFLVEDGLKYRDLDR